VTAAVQAAAAGTHALIAVAVIVLGLLAGFAARR
jgi:hypothetical protein